MQDRIKPLEGVRNFRDFGGYASSHGGHVRQGLLFRSGHYAEATEADIAAVETFNIGLQVDLRRPDERERMPGKWTGADLITHDGGRETDAPHQRFLERVEASAEKADNWMNDYYAVAPFKPHHQAMFTAWFEKLGETETGALVNCAAGKDRTGILCALTHHILGVSEDDIVADYELTNTAAKVDERIAEARDYFNDLLGKTYDDDVYRPFLGVRARYLATAFDAIKSEAGSVDIYLEQALGVDAKMRTQLVERLVA